MTWERLDPDTLDLENHRRELVMVEEVPASRQQSTGRRSVASSSWGTVWLAIGNLYGAPSGGLYDIVFVGRTDEPFPSGMEFWYLAEGFDQLPPKATIDADLWDLARDLVAGVEETTSGRGIARGLRRGAAQARVMARSREGAAGLRHHPRRVSNYQPSPCGYGAASRQDRRRAAWGGPKSRLSREAKQ